jgi:Fic/DOC family
MENNISPDLMEKHSSSEFKKLWACQKIVREWEQNPEWESYDVLPILYVALHTGKKFGPGAKDAPKLASVVRNDDASITGFPKDLLPKADQVYLLASKFSTRLDEILVNKHKNTEQAIVDAAFAYYVFTRIHPFPDGNGRIGRMIVKRVFRGAGLKDPIFHEQGWYGGGRSEHLDAIENVNDTNNLSHLEVFFAKSLIDMYHPLKEFSKHREISKVISDREHKTKLKIKNSLFDLWEGFTDPYLYGNNLFVEKPDDI